MPIHAASFPLTLLRPGDGTSAVFGSLSMMFPHLRELDRSEGSEDQYTRPRIMDLFTSSST
ncbi:hypothetical protein H0H81_012275 [Sphagnurus paluster]|uniref:Uncharacterized protein n=1 Tax=Sphagnurus paluster TaxID=117069 RepID=A0A9P7FNH2_9AGAR|nr:hypothetical protein H0H81_012275 [Sphagnurus paluster]